MTITFGSILEMKVRKIKRDPDDVTLNHVGVVKSHICWDNLIPDQVNQQEWVSTLIPSSTTIEPL